MDITKLRLLTFCVCNGDVCLFERSNPEKALPSLDGGAPGSAKLPSEVAGRPPLAAPERMPPSVATGGVASIVNSVV